MQNLGRKLEIFVIVTIIAFIGIIYAFKERPLPVGPESNVAQDSNPDALIASPQTATGLNPEATGTKDVSSPSPATVITYQGVDGKNALQLLEADHQVDVQHYSFGDMVSGIDGVKPDAKHFWAMYVNGNFSQVGASDYQTKSTDTVKWELDAVVDTTK